MCDVSKTCSQHQDALPTFEANTRFAAASFPLCHTVFAKLVTAISRTPWQEKLPFRDTLSEHPGLAAGMRLERATNLRLGRLLYELALKNVRAWSKTQRYFPHFLSAHSWNNYSAESLQENPPS